MKSSDKGRWWESSNENHKSDLIVYVRECVCEEVVTGWMWMGDEGSEWGWWDGGGKWYGIGNVREIRVQSVWCNPLDICALMTDKTRRVPAPGVLTHTLIYGIHTQRYTPPSPRELSLSGSQRLGTNETKWCWSLSVKRSQAVSQSGNWLE